YFRMLEPLLRFYRRDLCPSQRFISPLSPVAIEDQMSLDHLCLEGIAREVAIDRPGGGLPGGNRIDQEPSAVCEIAGDENAVSSGLQSHLIDLKPAVGHALDVLTAFVKKSELGRLPNGQKHRIAWYGPYRFVVVER